MESMAEGKPSARATRAAVADHAARAFPGAATLGPDIDGILRETKDVDPAFRSASAVGRTFVMTVLWIAFASGIGLSVHLDSGGYPPWLSALTAGMSTGLGYLGWCLIPQARDAVLRDADSQASFVDLARDAFVLGNGGAEFLGMREGVVRSVPLTAPSVLEARVSPGRQGRVVASVAMVDGTAYEVAMVRRDDPGLAAFQGFADRCADLRNPVAA